MVDDPEPQKIPLIFYRTEAGSEPVREWLKGLPETERQAIGKDLLRAQWRWPVGMPLCRALGSGLWESRASWTPAGISSVAFPSRSATVAVRSSVAICVPKHNFRGIQISWTVLFTQRAEKRGTAVFQGDPRDIAPRPRQLLSTRGYLAVWRR